MLDKLEGALQFKREALNLRAERQAVLANNIANADTPGFKARDIDFSKQLDQAVSRGRAQANGMQMSTTSERHLQGRTLPAPSTNELLYRTPTQPSMDGNTVDMDAERSAYADNAVRYQTSLTLMSGSLKRLKSAMQPE